MKITTRLRYKVCKKVASNLAWEYVRYNQSRLMYVKLGDYETAKKYDADMFTIDKDWRYWKTREIRYKKLLKQKRKWYEIF